MNCKKPNKLVQGVGINDVDAPTKSRDVDGKRVMCPFYGTWKSMLQRCYSPKEHARYPTYIGCSVVPEWHRFSVFKAWMVQQDWQDNQLDKDLLQPGNKDYGPETCIFVSQVVNSFVTESTASRGEWPIGVGWHKPTKKFRAYCRNPFTGKQEHLGLFDTPEAAHIAWLKRKRELAKQLAAVQDDPRVAKAIIARYESYEEDV